MCTIAQGVVGKVWVFNGFQQKGENSQTVRESLPIYFSIDNVLIYTDQKYRSIVSFDNLN